MGLLDVGRLVYIVVHRTELMGDSTHVLLLCHRVYEASKLEGNGVSRESRDYHHFFRLRQSFQNPGRWVILYSTRFTGFSANTASVLHYRCMYRGGSLCPVLPSICMPSLGSIGCATMPRSKRACGSGKCTASRRQRPLVVSDPGGRSTDVVLKTEQQRVLLLEGTSSSRSGRAWSEYP